MGKDNYECTLDPANLCSMGKCAFAPDQAKACLRRGLCPYQRARIRTHCNKCAFYNYSLFLSLPDRPLVKDWLIFDEASEMEDELVKAFTIELSYKSLKYSLSWIPPTPDSGSDSEEYRDWLIRLRDAFRSRMDELYTELRDTKRKRETPASTSSAAPTRRCGAPTPSSTACWKSGTSPSGSPSTAPTP